MRLTDVTLLLIVQSATLAGCARTRFQSTWTAPGAAPLDFSGRKVVALVQALDEGWGRPAELALAAELRKRGIEGVAAHTLVEPSERRDPGRLEARLRQAGIAGVVFMRVTRVRTEYPASGPAYVGTTHGGGFWDAWNDDAWTQRDLSALPPQGDTRVYVETRVYSVARNQLVWTGESWTRNPSSIDGLVAQLAEATAVQLRRAGLIGRAR